MTNPAPHPDDALREKLWRFLGCNDKDGSYWYVLGRVKEARLYGTLTMDDFIELEADTYEFDSLLNFITTELAAAEERGRREMGEAVLTSAKEPNRAGVFGSFEIRALDGLIYELLAKREEGNGQ